MDDNSLEKESDNDESQLNNEPTPQNPVVVVRKPKKKKKSLASRKEFEVQVIPATKGVTPPGEDAPVKRVAAYCRVSTDEEAQSTSFDLQVNRRSLPPISPTSLPPGARPLSGRRPSWWISIWPPSTCLCLQFARAL